MRRLRFITTALFGVTLAAWLLTGFWAEKKLDKKNPVITADSDSIQLSIEDEKEKLMEGLSAKDDRDGDLTGEIMIGSHSKFSAPGVLDMTYLVFDSANNCGQFTREVEYTDYESPKFSLNGPLIFAVNEEISVLGHLQLIDCIDGDISDKIKIVSSDINRMEEGVYTVGVEGINAYGDIVSQKLPVNIMEDTENTPEITLKKYLVYLDKSSNFDPTKYVKGIILPDGTRAYDTFAVEIDNPVNTDVPGCYNVLYSYTDISGNTGYTSLVVIVSGQED